MSNNILFCREFFNFMKKFVFIILVIIILLSLIFFPWLISLLNFDNNIYSGILTYAGATLGGLLTLLGVCATLF